jgi:NitT/TauT family transport system substrate-binding protein
MHMKKLLSISLSIWILLLSTAYGETKATEPVRIGYLQGDIHHLPLWVALEKKFFEDEGIEVETAGVFKAGPELMSAFSAGALDLGYLGEAPAVTAVINGAARVVALAQVNTEGSAIVVGKDSTLKTISDLAGKRVAIPGYATVQDFLLRKALAQAQIDPKTFSPIVVKPPEMIGALKTGQIDAFIAWEPYPAQAVNMDVGRVLVASGEIWSNHPCCVLAVDAHFAAANAPRIEKILRVHNLAIDFIHYHPQEAINIGVKYTGMPEGTISRAVENVKYTSTLNIEGLKEYVNFLGQMDYIKLKETQEPIEEFIHRPVTGDSSGK